MDTRSLDLPSLTVPLSPKSLHLCERPSRLSPKVVRFSPLRRPRAGFLITVCMPSRLVPSPPPFLARFPPQTFSLAILRRCPLPMRRLRLGRWSLRKYPCNPLRLPSCIGGRSRDRGSQTRIRRTRAATAACPDLGPSPVSLEASPVPCFPMSAVVWRSITLAMIHPLGERLGAHPNEFLLAVTADVQTAVARLGIISKCAFLGLT